MIPGSITSGAAVGSIIIIIITKANYFVSWSLSFCIINTCA